MKLLTEQEKDLQDKLDLAKSKVKGSHNKSQRHDILLQLKEEFLKYIGSAQQGNLQVELEKLNTNIAGLQQRVDEMTNRLEKDQKQLEKLQQERDEIQTVINSPNARKGAEITEENVKETEAEAEDRKAQRSQHWRQFRIK